MKPSGRDHTMRVGVTGGIGSGKSTVCSLFAARGRTVVSADRIAAELVEQDQEIRVRIRSNFGETLYSPDGSLDRKKLADIVFRHPSRRKQLNAIVHPGVFAAIDHRIEALERSARIPYVLIEAALIFETGMDRDLDYVIVVDAPEESRIGRVTARDGISREEVLQRMQAQMPVEQKKKQADFVIYNNSSEAELTPKVAFLDTLLSMQAARETVS